MNRAVTRDPCWASWEVCDVPGQITAALALIQMNATPVVGMHIPFGDDNHSDLALAKERRRPGYIASLLDQLKALGLQDQVTFLSHVFGRTMGPSNTDDRSHNGNHQMSLTISSRIKGGVIGAIEATPSNSDYGATSIDSKTPGQTRRRGRHRRDQHSFAKTVVTAVGVDPGVVAGAIPSGQVIAAAVA